jgi:hypothetical protein
LRASLRVHDGAETPSTIAEIRMQSFLKGINVKKIEMLKGYPGKNLIPLDLISKF